eukprot:4734358-Pleurochrysis_carterae.AAC.1
MRAAAALSRFAASLRGTPRTSSTCASPPRRACAPAPFIARGPSASARALLAMDATRDCLTRTQGTPTIKELPLWWTA